MLCLQGQSGKAGSGARTDLALDIWGYYGFCAQLLELAAISRLGETGRGRRLAPIGPEIRTAMVLISQSLRALAAALLVAGGLILAGCSGSMIADHMPTIAGGLPDNAPQRPANPSAYPAVHDQ